MSDLNPYSASAFSPVAKRTPTARARVFPNVRNALAWIGIGMALLIGAMGQLITFVPGAEAWWFTAAAAFACLGLLSPNWRVRVAATVLVLACGAAVWSGYQRGLRYQDWLRARGLPDPAIERFTA